MVKKLCWNPANFLEIRFCPYSEKGKICGRGKADLLSNVFMSVLLDDKAACQHVIRILTVHAEMRIKCILVGHFGSKAQQIKYMNEKNIHFLSFLLYFTNK